VASAFTPEVRAFLDRARWPAVLSTLDPDGSPITSAVWFGLLDGDIVIATSAGRPKARNAARDPRVSVIVDSKERPYRGVAIEGLAEVLPDPARATLYAIYERYLGLPIPPEAEDRIASSERVILRIHPRRVRPWNLP